MWCPGSETEIAIVTDTFVKIYDLSVDAISPLYYFLVCSDKIRDATIILFDQVRCHLLLSSFIPILQGEICSINDVYWPNINSTSVS